MLSRSAHATRQKIGPLRPTLAARARVLDPALPGPSRRVVIKTKEMNDEQDHNLLPICGRPRLLDHCGEREYPTLPRGEQRIARKQLRQLRDELGIRDELDRIETEQHYFAERETYAATIEPDGFELPF